jgi:hypothetical protein
MHLAALFPGRWVQKLRRGVALLGLAVVAFFACRPSQTDEPIAAPLAVTIAPPDKAPHVSQDGPVPGAAVEPSGGAGEPPESLTFLADGTLVVAGSRAVFARASDGTSARHAFAPGATVRVSSGLPGVAIESEGEVTLLATPSLAVLHHGKGKLPISGANVVVVEDGRAMLAQHGGALARFALTGLPADAAIETVLPVAGGARLNVTLSREGVGGGPIHSAVLFDPVRGVAAGRGIPLAAMSFDAAHGAHAGDRGFAVQGKQVSRVDLKTGSVQRSARPRCARDAELGNPTPSPDGSLLLVTCDADGVVLDGTTLAERRRIPRIIPGCDNGLVLDGVILPDQKTLLLEGCGGEARLDLASGRFLCADSEGLLGAPYEMLPGGFMGPRIVAGREQVPRCTGGNAQMAMSLGASGRYRLMHGEHLAVTHEGGQIDLEEDAGYPVIGPGEELFAYARGPRVYLRALPGGEVRAELVPLPR